MGSPRFAGLPMRPIVTCTRFEELVLREASGVELARPSRPSGPRALHSLHSKSFLLMSDRHGFRSLSSEGAGFEPETFGLRDRLVVWRSAAFTPRAPRRSELDSLAQIDAWIDARTSACQRRGSRPSNPGQTSRVKPPPRKARDSARDFSGSIARSSEHNQGADQGHPRARRWSDSASLVRTTQSLERRFS